ncbi:SDR family NAD(P)-dependent oxidoreductase [Parapedobacter sp. 10938]|uniref:SDR family NAD(P)-dependent oxidoreductase n=1 Tax=Parapedobacter flavus TaxID=3110225 RepID=UPI002DBF8C35|nr:SDR family oxidoreductase [Parapedobacter sp. 10938]MEC3881077.1 SDR family oxidoreductase [Parapedobacter sp. 10938]
MHRTALITGATKGMGHAITEKLAECGYNLLLAARNDRALAALKKQLETQYPDIHVAYLACDFSAPEQLNNLITWVDDQTADIDILINNVGIFKPVSVLDETDEDFRQQLQVNYITPHLLSRAVGQRMRKNRRGHIFNISSIASREPVSAAGTYTVTKFAVMGLTHVLREELRPHDVKVTEIIPGSTLTSSWEGTDIPADRFILPADIAEAIVTCLRMSDGANVEEVVIKPKYGNS